MTGTGFEHVMDDVVQMRRDGYTERRFKALVKKHGEDRVKKALKLTAAPVPPDPGPPCQVCYTRPCSCAKRCAKCNCRPCVCAAEEIHEREEQESHDRY